MKFLIAALLTSTASANECSGIFIDYIGEYGSPTIIENISINGQESATVVWTHETVTFTSKNGVCLISESL